MKVVKKLLNVNVMKIKYMSTLEIINQEINNEISIDIDKYENELKSAKNIDELKKIWSEIPAKAKVKLENLKNEIKLSYENTKI